MCLHKLVEWTIHLHNRSRRWFIYSLSHYLILNQPVCLNELDMINWITRVTYIGRNSTVSTRHRKNQRLSKTLRISAKARDFVRSQNKEKWPRENIQETHSFHDFQNIYTKKYMDINVYPSSHVLVECELFGKTWADL